MEATAQSEPALAEPAIKLSPMGDLKQKFLEHRSRITNATLAAIDVIDQLRVDTDADDLEGFLTTECRLSKDELATYLGFSDKLGSHKAILEEKGVSFAVLRSLIKTDEETRHSALMRIYGNKPVSTNTIAALHRFNVRAKLGPEEVASRARRSALKTSVARAAPAAIEKFELEISDLLALLQEFMNPKLSPIAWDSGEDEDSWSLSDDHKELAKTIQTEATKLVAEFKRLFGLAFVFNGQVKAGKPNHKSAMADALQALKRLASKQFSFRQTIGRPQGEHLIKPLQYLLPPNSKTIPSAPVFTGARDSNNRLSVLEICAGGGGQSIGLHAAGFQAAVLFEQSRSACATLKQNWDWPVVKMDVRKLDSEVLSEYRGIDLVAGGVPCPGYSRAGKRLGADDPRDLFGEAVRIVRLVKPRAFFFENVLGFTDKRHARHRARIAGQLRRSGYDVELHTMDAKDFGLPQDRKRIVLVGLMKDLSPRFKMPSLEQTWDVGIGDALCDVLMPYRLGAKGQLRNEWHQDDPNRAKHLENYDLWVEKWLSDHGKKKTPTITTAPTSSIPDIKARWRAVGLDINEIDDHAPEPHQVAGQDYLPHLTVEIAKRLQGFPDNWEFSGDRTAQIIQIGNAFPPRIAAAIGTSIREALTGEAINLRHALEAPMMVRPRILPPSVLLNGGGDYEHAYAQSDVVLCDARKVLKRASAAMLADASKPRRPRGRPKKLVA
jgi:DNA (cytosine-5)-methyltransferase 1